MNYKNQLDKRTRIVIFYFLFFLLLQRYLTVKNILTTIAKAYPANPSAGIPSILGVISVVQITLDAISSAATQSPTTIFLIAAEITLVRSSEECKSILTTDCPSKMLFKNICH